MVPILAGVIAYLDTNHNLDMLNEGGWALELWLRVLHDPSLCRLQYSDLLSMSGHQTELREFACRCTFAGEDMRGSSLPFSWVIVEMIETFLVKPPAQEDNEGILSISNVLSLYHMTLREKEIHFFISQFMVPLCVSYTPWSGCDLLIVLSSVSSEMVALDL